MVGGAAGHKKHPADVLNVLPAQADIVQNHPALPDAGGDGLAQGLRLLADLLHHKVLIAGLLRGGRVPFHGLHRLFQGVQVAVEKADPLPFQHGDLPVVQPADLPGVAENGGHVRGDEVFPPAQAHDQRAVLAHGEDLLRAVRADDPQGVAALHPAKDPPDGFQHVPLIVVLQQLGHHLGVRVGGKGHAPAL